MTAGASVEHIASGALTVLPYPVHIAAGALESVGTIARERAPAHRYIIITDDHVRPLYADRVAGSFGPPGAHVLSIQPGEEQKTRQSWAQLTDALLALGCGRDSVVVALGGGVVGDLAGFVAATYLRGIPFVQVPTTLLAMIDASIGGKTGVDTPAGKNLVGAFHQPAAVVIDPDALRTLPTADLRAGMAEAIKHGAIADADYLASIERTLPELLEEPAGRAMQALIAGSVEIKARVVAEDARESGRRKILNFGHTIGHAVESGSGYRLRHGEAVAIGLVLESRLAERAGVAVPGTCEQLARVVARAGLPTERPRELAVEGILQAMRADKKARGGMVEFALPERVGAMAGGERGWSVPVDEQLVREVLG